MLFVELLMRRLRNMLGVPDWRKPSNFAKRCYGGEGPSDLFRVVSRYDDNLDDFEFDHHHHYCHHTSTIKAKNSEWKIRTAEQLFSFLSTFLLQVYKYDDKQIVMMIIMITTMMTTMILMMAMMMMTLWWGRCLLDSYLFFQVSAPICFWSPKFPTLLKILRMMMTMLVVMMIMWWWKWWWRG